MISRLFFGGGDDDDGGGGGGGGGGGSSGNSHSSRGGASRAAPRSRAAEAGAELVEALRAVLPPRAREGEAAAAASATPAARRDAGFALRELVLRAREDAPLHEELRVKLPGVLEGLVRGVEAGGGDLADDEEVVQIVLELLSEALERHAAGTAGGAGTGGGGGGGGGGLYEDEELKSLVNLLVDLAQSESSAWIRLSAVQTLGSLFRASPQVTIHAVLAVPMALDRILASLDDPREEVRNEVVLLLQRLTEGAEGEQVRLFLTFSEATTKLLAIAAREPAESPVAADCVFVVRNALRGNAVGRRQFAETPESLALLADLLLVADGDRCSDAVLARIDAALSCVRLVVMSDDLQDARRLQARVGAVPGLLEAVVRAATRLGGGAVGGGAVGGGVGGEREVEVRRSALGALGDLTRGGGGAENAAKVEPYLGDLCEVALAAARWVDFFAACAAVRAVLEGPGVKIRLVGHALAPAPTELGAGRGGGGGGGAVTAEDAVHSVAAALVRGVRELRELGRATYVDPAKLAEKCAAVQRASRLWESFASGDAACQEMCLRLRPAAGVAGAGAGEDEGEPVFDVVLRAAAAFARPFPDESANFAGARRAAAAELLRCAFMWVYGCPPAASQLLGTPENLYLFEAAPRSGAAAPSDETDDLVAGMAALVAAACVVETPGDALAAQLLEARMGLDSFSKVVQGLQRTKAFARGRTLPAAAGGAGGVEYALLDQDVCAKAERVAAEAGKSVLRGLSAGGGGAGRAREERERAGENGHAASVAFTPPPSASRAREGRDGVGGSGGSGGRDGGADPGGDWVSGEEFRALQREHAELLLLLAEREVERQSLLETIRELGGVEAEETALRRSATLLARALEGGAGVEAAAPASASGPVPVPIEPVYAAPGDAASYAGSALPAHAAEQQDAFGGVRVI